MASLILKTLSPVHIGDGEDYNSFSFLARGSKLHFIDSTALQETLTQPQRDRLYQWLERERNPSLYRFLIQELGDTRLITKAISKPRYSIALEGQPPQKVFSFIKSSGKVYIPGTEIKGAFRTALLYKLMKNAPWHEVEMRVKKGLSKRKNRDEEIQQLAFRPFSREANYDLLRLLQVSDSELKEPSEALIAAPLIFIGLRRNISEAQNYHEVLKPEIEFNLDLKLQDDKFKPNFLDRFQFTSQQIKLVGSELSLFQCAYEFYDKVLKEEILFHSKTLQERGISDYFKKAHNSAINSLRDINAKNSPQTPLIRLGKHEGFLSLTLGLAIKDRNPEFYHNVLIHATKGTSYSFEFPKTRKLIRVGGKELPLGWVQLRIER